MSIIDTSASRGSVISTGHPLRSNLPLLSILGSGIVWGFCWWPLKMFADAGLTGIWISMTAYALVGIVAIPVVWRQRNDWRGEGGLLLLIGLFFGFANVAFTTALMQGEVVRVMLLFYLLPAWGAIGGTLFLGERLSRPRCIAILLSLAGVFVIMGGTAVLDQALSTADILALTAGLGYSAAGIVNHKATPIPMASRSFIPFIFCALMGVAAHAVLPSALPSLSPTIWSLLAVFAFVWLLGGTLLTTYGVAHIEASRASVLQVVELLVSVVTAVLIGGELLDTKEWIGGAMIVVATLMESIPTSTKPGA
jgi:drug/metabolite transporter (DMT)-like permease